MTERLGLLGGTFDPPHYGHLIAGHEAASQLGLRQVLLLPARRNPLKQDELVSPAEVRCRMVELAIADNPLLALSRADLDRPGPSYTVDLLRALSREDTELFFIAGADVVTELQRWHAPNEVLRLATLVVANRPSTPEPDLDHLVEHLPSARGRVLRLRIPGVDISASDIRRRVRAARSIRYLTHPAVEAFILQEGLYRDPA